MSELRLKLPEKLEPLFRPARYKVAYGGRGSAKSWSFARALLFLGWQERQRILCAREIQRTIADSVHRLLADQLEPLNLSGFYEVTDNAIRGKNGSEFLFAGLRQQDVHKIKSFEGVDKCWVEEAHVVTKRSWEILIPTIRKEGSEIWVTFNPELDTDDTYRRFVEKPPPGAVVVEINWRDNPWFPEVLVQEKEHLKRTDPEAYENVWEGKPASSLPGAIYRHEIAKVVSDRRIRPVPYDPMLKVHTVWDLGFNDSMFVIMAQRLRSEIRVIDCIEDTGRVLADYVAELEKRRYRWGIDWLPHDAEHKDYKYGTDAVEIFRRLNRNPYVVPNVGLEQGIRVARTVFPRVYFDEDKAERLVECLRRYRRAIPVTTEEPAKPLHDEYSHGADAFRYMSLIADRMDNEAVVKMDYSALNKGVV